MALASQGPLRPVSQPDVSVIHELATEVGAVRGCQRKKKGILGEIFLSLVVGDIFVFYSSKTQRPDGQLATALAY
ncbi:hypothetical protein CEXT_571751 [Caerostris extrusa]|uniref:Uncharacterized protein n=1 Tax=Caerostris extrusa TaxID=172846 RepID=A0AAV4PJP9_CAEEX|nr:hypothetical protein CEXT_571751 [Caerostris extrusa]